MRFAQIRKMDISNGSGIGVSLFVQGCLWRLIHCPGCHNSNIWDFNGGEEYTQKTEQQILELIKPDYNTRMSVLGGEPLIPQNYAPLAHLIKEVKAAKDSIKIWLYTGYIYENLKKVEDENLQCILSNIDYLVDGPYIESQRDITLAFRGSRNQRILRREGENFLDVTQSFDN